MFPVFPRPGEDNFNNRVYQTLDTWQRLLEEIATRVDNIEGFLAEDADYTPDEDAFIRRIADVLLERNVLSKTLYVDPVNGSNYNDGLSWDTAVQTLRYAFDKIPPGCVATVYLAPGHTYIMDYDETFSNSSVFIRAYGTSDRTITKIVFEKYLTGYSLASRGFTLYNSLLYFYMLTLENEEKGGSSGSWAPSTGAYLPIRVGTNVAGNSTVVFNFVQINQNRDYFISTKHAGGTVAIATATINFSDYAQALICNDFGTCQLGVFNCTATTGYSYVSGGTIGQNVLCNLDTLDT